MGIVNQILANLDVPAFLGRCAKAPPGSFQAGLLIYMNVLIKEYLAWKGTYAIRASTNYRIWLERFVEVCGLKSVEQYQVADVIKYRNWVETRYSPYTVMLAMVVMKNFFQFCKTQNYSCLSPTLIRLPRFIAKSHRAVTEDEFKKIISVIPENEFKSLRDLLMIWLLWDTGIRVSELCGMDVSDINEHKRSAVIQTKKNSKKRIIVWSEETHRLLMKYMTIRLELNKINHASALFAGWCKGRGWSIRLTSRSVERRIEYYVDRAGIKERITPHSFRHGWAHIRRDNNAPLAFIQKGLGHVSPISTFVYEQYNDQEFEKNADTYLKAA